MKIKVANVAFWLWVAISFAIVAYTFTAPRRDPAAIVLGAVNVIVWFAIIWCGRKRKPATPLGRPTP